MTAPNATVSVGNTTFSNSGPLTLIAGPCQLESRDHAFDMAGALKEICAKLGLGLVYKTSYDKANRTSLSGTRGAGLDAALPVFDDLRKEFGLPILTDVHTAEQCAIVARHVDILQIPAFLSRQTDLLIAAARDRQGRQRQEGPVPGPLGHEERRRQDHRVRQPQCAGDRARRLVRLQHAGVGHARAADHGRDGRAGDLRRHAFGAAAGRAGRFDRRRAPLRRDAGARGRRRRRRRRVHRDPSGSRQCAFRRPQHGAAEGHARRCSNG